MFMQRLWRLSIDWKYPLPKKVYDQWHQLLIGLESLNNIHIQRRVVIENPTSIEIHGFSDASERCYGAAVYCKSKNNSGVTLVRLITSKSRVSPIKSLTIPRLELCAAVLLSKLVKRVIDALKLESVKVYLWTDSMIVLSWLQKEPMDLKTFVQNRIAKLQDLFPVRQWKHVPSNQNPADLISRGVDPDKLLNQEMWWNGPEFLSGSDYPNKPVNISENNDAYNSELKNSVLEKLENEVPVFNIFVRKQPEEEGQSQWPTNSR
ncbi:uncharacterized protein TNCT_339981 [Trichonephila clavata]|uniref:Uncharacterized protein n=1 Tax=Trichonephila clavata TaxID=2740835 RepID=A0A8X6GBR4_TRICU|nr:uncharacterized protein TNCT_339981 [Trichonephila clavata]